MPFSILMVCTGNIFRSPAAQYLMTREFGDDAGVRVVSAGTDPVTGHGVASTMAELLREAGVDPGAHVAQLLTMDLVREADLVIGMTQAHRARAVALWPDAYGRCYTLNELARLARTVTLDELGRHAVGVGAGPRLAALVELTESRRTPVTTADDIADPVGQGPEIVRAVFTEIDASVDSIARLVRGRRRRPRPAGS